MKNLREFIAQVHADMDACTETDHDKRMKELRRARALRDRDSRAIFKSFYGHEPEEEPTGQ
jgi:hypothetical protein